jgi:hypothetical protein
VASNNNSFSGCFGGVLRSLCCLLGLRESAPRLSQGKINKIDTDASNPDLQRRAPEHRPSRSGHRLLCFQIAALYLIVGIFLGCYGVSKLIRADDLRRSGVVLGWRLGWMNIWWALFTFGIMGLCCWGTVTWHPDSAFFILSDKHERGNTPEGTNEKQESHVGFILQNVESSYA